MQNSIKAIILDVDGAIVGEKKGINSPNPSLEVINCLRQFKGKGIHVVLLTAKPHFAISKIIKDIDSNNPHITDGGAILIDPLKHKIIKQNIIPRNIVSKTLKMLLAANIYTEIYTSSGYYTQKSFENDKITAGHEFVLQTKPTIVDDLIRKSQSLQVTKIMPVAIDEQDKSKVQTVLNNLTKDLLLSWGFHRILSPLQFAILTAKGISKKTGVIEISEYLNIPLKNMLGVGDSTSDWQFLELCEYSAAMGNASQELKDLVLQKESGKGFVGGNVDDDGVLDIFKFFKLT